MILHAVFHVQLCKDRQPNEIEQKWFSFDRRDYPDEL